MTADRPRTYRLGDGGREAAGSPASWTNERTAEPATTVPGRTFKIYGLYLVLYLIAIAPIVSATTLPILDYPNHIARLHVLATIEHSEHLQRFFDTQWMVLPNLAFDVFGLALVQLVSVDTAGKLFICLSMALVLLGVAALHRALHHSISPVPVVTALFLLSWEVTVGLLNYFFSLGVYLLFLAGWIASAERPPWQRLLLFNVAGAILFFAHLYGLALYVLSIAAIEAPRLLMHLRSDPAGSVRNALVTAGQFVMPAALFLYYHATVPAFVSRGKAGPLFSAEVLTIKAKQLINFVAGYSLPLDMASAGLLAAVLAFGLLTGRLRIDRRMLFVLAALAVAYLFLPIFAFSGGLVPHRLPIVMALITVAAIDVSPAAGRFGKIVLASILILFVARTAVLVSNWREMDRELTQYLRLIETMPEGSRVTAAIAEDERLYRGWVRPPLWHFGNYVTTMKDGFYSTIFAKSRQQPVALEPQYQILQQRYNNVSFQNGSISRSGEVDPFNEQFLKNFDYLMLFRPDRFQIDLPNGLTPIYDAGLLRVYSIDLADDQPSTVAAPPEPRP